MPIYPLTRSGWWVQLVCGSISCRYSTTMYMIYWFGVFGPHNDVHCFLIFEIKLLPAKLILIDILNLCMMIFKKTASTSGFFRDDFHAAGSSEIPILIIYWLFLENFLHLFTAFGSIKALLLFVSDSPKDTKCTRGFYGTKCCEQVKEIKPMVSHRERILNSKTPHNHRRKIHVVGKPNNADNNWWWWCN